MEGGRGTIMKVGWTGDVYNFLYQLYLRGAIRGKSVVDI